MLLFLGFNTSARYATIIGKKKKIIISILRKLLRNFDLFIIAFLNCFVIELA